MNEFLDYSANDFLSCAIAFTIANLSVSLAIKIISIVHLPRRIRRLAIAKFCKRDIRFMVIEQPLLTDRTL